MTNKNKHMEDDIGFDIEEILNDIEIPEEELVEVPTQTLEEFLEQEKNKSRKK